MVWYVLVDFSTCCDSILTTFSSLFFSTFSAVHVCGCRSQDGRLLVVSSTDGYCTLVSFDAGELGTEYEHSTCEVLAQSACVKKEEDKPVTYVVSLAEKINMEL